MIYDGYCLAGVCTHTPLAEVCARSQTLTFTAPLERFPCFCFGVSRVQFLERQQKKWGGAKPFVIRGDWRGCKGKRGDIMLWRGTEHAWKLSKGKS